MRNSLPFASYWNLPLNVVALATVLCTGLALAAGSLDPASQRSRLTIKEEPKDAQQILFVQKTMAAANRRRIHPRRAR